jgi:hypothetical protein
VLRTREFDQRDADGERPRRWVALLPSRSSLPPRRRPVSVAPSSLSLLPRQLQTPHSTPLTISVAKNAPGDRSQTTTKFPSRPKSIDAMVVSKISTSPKSANKNILATMANMAILAASKKPALFHPPGRPSNNPSPFLSRPPHPSATPKPLSPNAFQLRSPFRRQDRHSRQKQTAYSRSKGQRCGERLAY